LAAVDFGVKAMKLFWHP